MKALKSLGLSDPVQVVESVQDGTASLLKGEAGTSAAVLRHGQKFDILVLGAEEECPVSSLRAILETAVLPLSDEYAAHIGVASPERDAVRKRIREASVALDVISKGRHFSVSPPDVPLHPVILEQAGLGITSADGLPVKIIDDLALLNQLQSTVVTWSREIDRVVQLSRSGPGALLSVEEETVFWSSLDAALAAAQQRLSSSSVRLTLDILARKRRATGFLHDAKTATEDARRRASGVLSLIHGLPVVTLRTAEDLSALRKGVSELLEHVSSKLRVSSFSIERVMSLVESMGFEVSRSMGRILSCKGGVLALPFDQFVDIFQPCYSLFETWAKGFDHCRKVARESARAKGESMPSRRKSPLSHLHAHLTEVYELRSHHRDLAALFHDLLTVEVSSKSAIEALDSAYDFLVQESDSIDHFQVTPKEQAHWENASRAYRSRSAAVEKTASAVYRRLTNDGESTNHLCISLRPFRIVMGKPFMAQAVSEAVPVVLRLARRNFGVLQDREMCLKKNQLSNRTGGAPTTFDVLSQYRLLQARANELSENVEQIVGKAYSNLSSELRTFLAELDQLRRRVDPAKHAMAWFSRLESENQAASLFELSHRSRASCLRLTLSSDAASFFTFFRSIRAEQCLRGSLSPKHQELARFSRGIHPSYRNLREAIQSYCRSREKIVRLGEAEFSRTSSLLEEKQTAIHKLLENAVGRTWKQPGPKFFEFSFSLRQICCEFETTLESVLEKDRLLSSSIQDLDLLQPKFADGKVCDESRTKLQQTVKRFRVCWASLGSTSGGLDAREVATKHWVPKLRSSLKRFLERLRDCWIQAARTRRLGLPTVVIDVTQHAAPEAGLQCAPSVREMESMLYLNAGEAYSSFCHALDQLDRDDSSTERRQILSAGEILTEYLGEQNSRHRQARYLQVSSVVDEAIQRLLKIEESWNSCLRSIRDNIGNDDLTLSKSVDDDVVILEKITSLYEEVLALNQEGEVDASGLRNSESVLAIDTSSLSHRVSSRLLGAIRVQCRRVSVAAAETSQEVYRRISVTKNVLSEAQKLEGIDALATLQSVKEEALPCCARDVDRLGHLERLLEDVSRRTGDSSLSPTNIAETWILSEEVMAHFRSLHDLHERRTKSILVNHEELVSKYKQTTERHHQGLTTAFARFQEIRIDSPGDRDLFDSTSALDQLEKELTGLASQALDLERIGNALGVPHLPEHNGPQNILLELQKVRGGIEKLCCIEEKLAMLSKEKLRTVDPARVQKSLTEWADEVGDIANLSGARREANYLKDRLDSLVHVHSYLKGLHSVVLSPVRERDLMRQLFGGGYPKGGVADITLDMFWHADISTHSKYLREVFENAAGEASICEFLRAVEQTWTCRKCTFMAFSGAAILQGIPNIVDELEEHLQGLETLSSSRHARLFEADRAAWEQRLAKCHDDLELLADVQSRWAHLQTLFVARGVVDGGGLRTELRAEILAFSNVHARFVGLGERMRQAPGLLEGLDGPSGLLQLREELDGIVRSLSKFLERQRSQFPRFFFLSDTDLLHVLSVSENDIETLSPHISKIFPGVSSFELTRQEGRGFVSAVHSREGETLLLPEPVTTEPGEVISSWLRRLECQISSALKGALLPALQVTQMRYMGSDSKTLHDFITPYLEIPSQIAFLATKISFAREVEKCLLAGNEVASRLQRLASRIEGDLVALARYRAPDQANEDLRKKFHLSRDHLIKEFVYQRNIVSLLREESVTHPSSHFWQHEIRCYHLPCKDNSAEVGQVVLRCGSGEFSYGWEYLGTGEMLVHTALTSRCFLNLTEALRRGYGGSPFGPAGTGKTETVKALGRLMGRFVAVFNCDESFDAVSVGRILAGACRVGSWVCFDEFNRLSSSILSTTSGQLATMQASIKRAETVMENFYGGELPVTIRNGVGVFITTNPKYSGRRELPANLKSLFRPCAMPKPDSLAIVEVLLLSQGFRSSTSLAQRLVCLFYHLGVTLQSRPHYDFGLRSLKSTVLAAGSLLGSAISTSRDVPRDGLEEDIMITALGEIVKPKLEGSDISTYRCAIKATFTNASCLDSMLPPRVEAVLADVMAELGIYRDVVLLDKIRELFSLLEHQSGVILVGPTGSGKSITWRTLFEVLKRLSTSGTPDSERGTLRQSKSSLTVLDPKILSTEQLYGSLDLVTREWSDGLFTKVLRSLSDVPENGMNTVSSSFHWIVFDGDVDPDWVENLNSVLDDNRILTLPNGEHIPLLPNTRILFETGDLNHANPSTVSRCGMVCFADIQMNSVKEIFVSSAREVVSQACPACSIPRCFRDVLQKVAELGKEMQQGEGLVMRIPIWSLLHSVLQLLRVSLLDLLSSPKETSTELSCYVEGTMSAHISGNVLLRVLLVVSVKGLAGGSSREIQRHVSKRLLTRLRGFDEIQDALAGEDVPSNFAEVYLGRDGKYKRFGDLVAERNRAVKCEDVASPDLVISTPSTVQLEALVRESVTMVGTTGGKIRPLVLCGPPGCGKSMVISVALREIPNISLCTLSFSSETSSENIITALRGHAEFSKRSNGTYVLHPKAAGCRIVLFCDEVNLEKPDPYETQSSICFLRSLAERGGFWHGSPPTWVAVEGIQVMAACNPEQDSGRHVMSARFLKCCHVVRVDLPCPEDLSMIYGIFIEALLQEVHHGLSSKAKALTAAVVNFFSANKMKFHPDETGPIEAHYIYSPRELSRWIRGMKVVLNLSSPRRECHYESKGVSLNVLWDWIVSAFCYEARRVFIDRLLREDERIFAEETLLKVVEKHLKPKLSTRPDDIYTSWFSRTGEQGNRSRHFELVKSPKNFRSLIYQHLRIFAEEEGLGGSWMSGAHVDGSEDTSAMIDQFAVTDDVLTHLTRIERVLCQPLGHIVLMGASGTGKKTLARFAAWMLSLHVYQIHSHSSYSEEDFATELRLILRKAGVDGHQIMIIFDESNAMECSFLEMMNSLLACGEVPGLYSGDERIRLIEDLKAAGAGGMSSSAQALYMEFVRRIRQNLHIVFAISTDCTDHKLSSAIGADLTERSPALYNRCTVDWIGDWSRQTLEAVAELKIEVALGKEKDQIIRSAVEMHEVAKENFKLFAIPMNVTPRHYLEFIEQINRIALEKGNAIQSGADRHTEGLRRLEAAGNAVDDVKESLNEKSEHLRRKEVLANETLERMIEEQSRAEKAKVEAEQLALAAEEAATRVQEREEEVAEQLAGVRPKIETAREAVKSIRKEYLEELRAMPNPPSGVRVALEGVLMVLDGATRKSEVNYSWSSIRSRMRGSEFISSVANFDVDAISKVLRVRIEKQVLRNPDFDVGRISYASRAAGPLAQWTLAVLDYSSVKEGVEPLEEEVRDLQDEQVGLLEKQESALQDVNALQEKIEKCRSKYAALVSESERIRQDIQESEANLCRAEQMLTSLGDEFSRWVDALKGYNAAAVTVWGNAVYAAAFIAYAGSMDYMSRNSAMRDWRRVLHGQCIQFDENMRMSDFLTSAEERGFWSARSLPTDEASLENYAILKRSARFPLIVNPNRSSSELLEKVLGLTTAPSAGIGSDEAETLRLTQSSFLSTSGKKSYMRALESSMRFGASVLLDDAEKLDRAVLPLLGQEASYGDSSRLVEVENTTSDGLRKSKRNSKQGSDICGRVVRLGEKDVFLSSRFRLYMATASVHPVPTAAVTRCNVVSFELSPAALKSTCVSRALRLVLPQLEARKSALLRARLQYEQSSRLLEEKVLSAITDVQDLEREILGGSLLDFLSSLKREVKNLETRQAEEAQASHQIKKAEADFLALGDVALDAFCTLQGLAALLPLYSFNTSSFLQVFEGAIAHCVGANCQHDQDIQVALPSYKQAVIMKTFTEVAASLFPKDRVIFAASLAFVSFSHEDMYDGKVPSAEEMFRVRKCMNELFCRSASLTSDTQLDRTKSKEKLPLSIQKNLDALTDNRRPIRSPYVGALMVLRNMESSPHCLHQSIEDLACTLPGHRDLVHGTGADSEVCLRRTLTSFAEIHSGHQTGNRAMVKPLLLCTRGESSDPATRATEIAHELNIAVISVAMGSTITCESISRSIADAIGMSAKTGPVMLLFKNLHLSTEQASEQLQNEVKKQNGLFPCLVVFAAELLNEGISARFLEGYSSFSRILSFETPQSFRACFTSSLDKISARREQENIPWPYSELEVDDMHVALCWLHATLLERALHAPVGFCSCYEFSDSDLMSAWDVISSRACPALSQETYLATVAHMLINTTYGCRIENGHDLEIVRALVRDLFAAQQLIVSERDVVTTVFAGVNVERIRIPKQKKEQTEFVRSMPSTAPPWWSRMPIDASKKRQVAEGRLAVHKILQLSEDKFNFLSEHSAESKRKYSAGEKETSTEDALQDVYLFAEKLHSLRPSPLATSDHNPWNCYLEVESNILVRIVDTVHRDLEELSSVGSGTLSISSRAFQLKKDLREVVPTQPQTLPMLWFETCSYYGRDVSVMSFFQKLEGSLLCLRELVSGSRTISISATLRPEALLEALRFEEAKRQNLSPYSMQLHMRSTSMPDSESRSLSGIRLNGMSWESNAAVFQICDVQSAETSSLAFWFRSKDVMLNVPHVTVPFYGREREAAPLASVRVPASNAVSLAEWRLSSASISLI